jgi:hypothetical protein
MIILIPLCTLVPTLAKIAHFKMQTPQVSRYLGWQEAMTGTSIPNDVAKTHIQERILKSNQLAVQTQQQVSTHGHQNPLWSVQSKRIHDTSKFQATTSTRISRNSDTQGTTSIIKAVTSGLSALSEGDFKFEKNGIAQHDVDFSLNAFGLIDQTNCDQNNVSNSTLCLSQKHVLFTRSLAAKSDETIISQVNSLKPLSKANAALNIISDLAKATEVFKEGSGLNDAALHVATEALPQDRLKRNK